MNLFVSTMSSPRSVSLLYYPDFLILLCHFGLLPWPLTDLFKAEYMHYHTLTSLLSVYSAFAVLPSHLIKEIHAIKLAPIQGSSKELVESQVPGLRQLHAQTLHNHLNL